MGANMAVIRVVLNNNNSLERTISLGGNDEEYLYPLALSSGKTEVTMQDNAD
jgi:hypothetical protein